MVILKKTFKNFYVWSGIQNNAVKQLCNDFRIRIRPWSYGRGALQVYYISVFVYVFVSLSAIQFMCVYVPVCVFLLNSFIFVMFVVGYSRLRRWWCRARTRLQLTLSVTNHSSMLHAIDNHVVRTTDPAQPRNMIYRRLIAETTTTTPSDGRKRAGTTGRVCVDTSSLAVVSVRRLWTRITTSASA